MVRFYKGCTGLKTGTTDGAGSCLSASATRDNLELIAVTMGSGNSKDRFSSAKSLLDYGFSNFTLYKPKIDMGKLSSLKVLKGTKNAVKLTLDAQIGRAHV